MTPRHFVCSGVLHKMCSLLFNILCDRSKKCSSTVWKICVHSVNPRNSSPVQPSSPNCSLFQQENRSVHISKHTHRNKCFKCCTRVCVVVHHRVSTVRLRSIFLWLESHQIESIDKWQNVGLEPQRAGTLEVSQSWGCWEKVYIKVILNTAQLSWFLY